MTERKRIKNLKVAKILTEFVLSKYREITGKQLQNEIFQMEKNEEDILIEEISKKIINHLPNLKNKENKSKERRNSILYDRQDSKSKSIRNVEAIYLTLLKFKGLKRYMNYQGLCIQDIRNFSCYIKHKFYEKGSYIVRQYDKSDALYGIINGCIEVRELETIEKTKEIFLSIANDNGDDDEEMEKIFKKIPIDYFLSDIESEIDNDDDENDNKDNKDNKENKDNKNNKDKINKDKDKNKNNNSDDDNNDDYITKLNNLKRKYRKKLKTVQYKTSPLKQKYNFDSTNTENNFKKLLRKKRNSIIKKIAIEERQTPIDKLEGLTLEYFKLEFEEKRVTLKKGMCFGEWGIVYNIPRTTSIYCPVDTNIFYLEKKYFNKILLSKFLESDLKKVQFILDRIPIFKKDLKIRNLLTKIPPEFFEKNHIVYTPFDEANTIYLVYKGECIIGELPFYVNNKKEYLNKFDQIKTLSFLDEGGIAGLESSQGFKNYKHCLIIKREFTILLKLNVEYLNKIYLDFGESIQSLYDKQSHRIEEFKSESNLNKKRIKIRTQILNEKEFQKELNKPIKIKKDNLLKLNKSIFNNDKFISLSNRNHLNNTSHFPLLNKSKNESHSLIRKDSSKFNSFINQYKHIPNKNYLKKRIDRNKNIFNIKAHKLFLRIPKSYYKDESVETNEKNNSYFKKIKITQNDIISELKLPIKLKPNNYFGKNQSNTGHYNITFISNLV